MIIGTQVWVADNPLEQPKQHEIIDTSNMGKASESVHVPWLYFDDRGPAIASDCFLTIEEAEAHLSELRKVKLAELTEAATELSNQIERLCMAMGKC